METVATKRNTWVACPECGHKVGKARTCDMEFKCKNCGHEFEAVIGPSPRPRQENGKRRDPSSR